MKSCSILASLAVIPAMVAAQQFNTYSEQGCGDGYTGSIYIDGAGYYAFPDGTQGVAGIDLDSYYFNIYFADGSTPAVWEDPSDFCYTWGNGIIGAYVSN